MESPRVSLLAPSLITGAGLLAGLFGLALYPRPLGLLLMAASLLLDVLDGQLARRLGACSSFGGQLDWHTDVALAHVAALRIGLACNVALVVLQAINRARAGERTSGRALAFAYLIASAVRF
ncbi:MAG: CDP-alcohol phosphatidyltransferase family protein [Myxococcales bacterium]